VIDDLTVAVQRRGCVGSPLLSDKVRRIGGPTAGKQRPGPKGGDPASVRRSLSLPLATIMFVISCPLTRRNLVGRNSWSEDRMMARQMEMPSGYRFDDQRLSPVRGFRLMPRRHRIDKGTAFPPGGPDSQISLG
jgi:hypothetical protein